MLGIEEFVSLGSMESCTAMEVRKHDTCSERPSLSRWNKLIVIQITTRSFDKEGLIEATQIVEQFVNLQ